MNGWRPISVTYQPATVAIQPENVIAATLHSSALGSLPGCQPARRNLHHPSQLTSSISTPMPTMTRNAMNTGSTGGCASRNSFRPFTSPFDSCVRMKLATPGTFSA